MEIIKAGIDYRLENFRSEGFQSVRFTEKVGGDYVSGTTNEEVISMLIDRLYELQKRNFSVENQCCIILLKNVRVLFKKRLNRKIDRVSKYDLEHGVRDKGNAG